MARTIFWPGAHKTGTTYLQKCLELNRARLEEEGVTYLETGRFRELYTRPLLNLPGPVADSVFSAEGPGTNLIFDENIVSLVARAPGADGVYAEAGARARRMADHLGLAPDLLVFTIRSFAEFLPSAYCETLKVRPGMTFPQYCATPDAKLRWRPVLADLRAAFPGARMLVVPHETLRGREAALLGHVLGIDPAGLEVLPEIDRPGFSGAAIAALRDIRKDRAVTSADVSAAVRRFPKGPEHPAFAPFSKARMTALWRAYAAELVAIAGDPGVELWAG